MSAADECGWRKYPPAGTVRIIPRSFRNYAEADALESMINNLPQSDLKFRSALLQVGTGRARAEQSSSPRQPDPGIFLFILLALVMGVSGR